MVPPLLYMRKTLVTPSTSKAWSTVALASYGLTYIIQRTVVITITYCREQDHKRLHCNSENCWIIQDNLGYYVMFQDILGYCWISQDILRYCGIFQEYSRIFWILLDIAHFSEVYQRLTICFVFEDDDHLGDVAA